MKFHIINAKLTHSDRKMQLFTFIGKVTRESHKPPEIEKLGVWGFSQDETRRDEDNGSLHLNGFSPALISPTLEHFSHNSINTR